MAEPCTYCGEPVLPADRYPIPNAEMHTDCFIRGVVGGVNHQLGKCKCCGGTEPPDPPGMTLREAARAAVRLFEERENP